ncbi:MAG: hypothetical protein Q4G64_08160 [bacterium]|nr:hypothetical protein [bacterium]
MSALHPPGGATAAHRDAVVSAVLAARELGAAMVMVDGRSGSGKTELAAVLAEMVPGSRVLHLEDAYRGWFGLAEGLEEIATGVLVPLAEGRWGSYESWDWEADEPGGRRVVEPLHPGGVLLVEGCGALAEPCAPFADLGIWCEAPEHVRRARASTRDPYDWSEQWESWARQEEALTYSRTPDLVLHTAHTAHPSDTPGSPNS